MKRKIKSVLEWPEIMSNAKVAKWLNSNSQVRQNYKVVFYLCFKNYSYKVFTF